METLRGADGRRAAHSHTGSLASAQTRIGAAAGRRR